MSLFPPNSNFIGFHVDKLGPLHGVLVSAFPHNKFLVSSELKAVTDDKIHVNIVVHSVYKRVENIVEKEAKRRYPAFSPVSYF